MAKNYSEARSARGAAALEIERLNYTVCSTCTLQSIVALLDAWEWVAFLLASKVPLGKGATGLYSETEAGSLSAIAPVLAPSLFFSRNRYTHAISLPSYSLHAIPLRLL